jgi:hypothetical protein
VKRLLSAALLAFFVSATAGAQIAPPPGLPKPITSTPSAAPASTGTWSSRSTAFNGDLSNLTLPLSYSISGAASLGQPATGYKYTEELSPVAGFLTNTSGWNQSAGSNDGRTGATFMRLHGLQNGQGDLAMFNSTCTVGTSLAGATSFLANPACALVNGDTFAGAAGAYLQPLGDLNCNDQGFDVACLGLVENFTRTVNTGALGAFWGGARMQSKGSAAADVAYSATGSWNFGLDLSGASLGTNNAAITTKRDQCWYGNVTATDSNPSGIYRYPSALGTDKICNSSTNSGWIFVSGNSSSLQVTSGQVTVTQPFSHTNVEKDTGFSIQTPSTGFSITVSDAWSSLILDPAGTLASGTITFPPTPSNGRIINVSSTQTVTALTLSANTGQTSKCAHTTIAAGTSFRCIYQTSNTTWYPY